MKYISTRYNNYEFTFESINVFLGANGAGKSKLLIELKDHLNSQNMKPIFIEGGRTIKIKDIIKLERSTYEQYELLENAKQQYENKRAVSLADRLFDALIILEKKEQQMKSKHSDDVEIWINKGKLGDCPLRPTPPLDRLFSMFSEIFPLITLRYNYESKRLSALKNGNTYGPSSFSDGEKQVFSILADFIDLEDNHKVIIADEPELNLHPELAERVWTLIESEFPDKIFIYATHSINFALRKNVKKVYVLSNNSDNITVFNDLNDLPRTETTAFLGGLPGILSANKVVVTEGHEKSFDAIFYRWLLNDAEIEIFPAGSCTDVTAVVTRNGLWEKIASRVSLCGVIDCDFRDDTYNQTLITSNVLQLPFHEAESYICLPQVINKLAKRIGSQENIITEEQVSEIIINEMNEKIHHVVAKRVFTKAKINLAVSIEKKELQSIQNIDQLKEKILLAAEQERKKASISISNEKIVADVDTEYSMLKSYISTKNIVDCLKVIPGKELLNKLATKVGCKNSADLMRALRTNFKPSDFIHISELSDKLTTILT